MRKSLAAEALASAVKNLDGELRRMRKNERSFLEAYRRARLNAFQLEFLAKFLRKSKPANREIFETLHGLTKELEDRLGAFNETDELISLCEKLGLRLNGRDTAAAYFTDRRHKGWRSLNDWLKNTGWYGSKTAEVRQLLGRLEDYGTEELREAAVGKMIKVTREIQAAVEDGEYSPKKKSGYVMSEVESKVHELRREIRKIPMYASYLPGLFTLDSKKVPGTFYGWLAKTELVKSEYARLPRARVKRPIEISLFHYLAINRYVLELGAAKDWAQNLERLREAGLSGEVSFDQLDLSLRDAFGQTVPFNELVGRITGEIRKARLFTDMAKFFEKQR